METPVSKWMYNTSYKLKVASFRQNQFNEQVPHRVREVAKDVQNVAG